MTLSTLEDEKMTDAISKNHEKKIQRKQRRFQHMIANDAGVVCCNQPTKVGFSMRYLCLDKFAAFIDFRNNCVQNLVICNAGLSTGLDQTALVSEFSQFGALNDVCLLRDKSYCFVICADEINSREIYNATHAKSRLGQNDTVIYLTYCIEGLSFYIKKCGIWVVGI